MMIVEGSKMGALDDYIGVLMDDRDGNSFQQNSSE